MTLYETIDLLKKIALKHPNIGSASEGNIYEYMNANPSVKYGVFFITQGTHSQDEMFNHFEFTLFYVDRLVDDMEENRLQIQSIGKEILSNILTFFCEEFEAECENISFQPFTQRFVDETAGIYSTITIDMPKDIICPEEYWKEDWKTPVIAIHNQDKRVVFTENGTYTIDYDPNTYTGLGTVEVNVNIDVDSYYNNGYNQGKTDGIDEQKSKLSQIRISENGTYANEDGYNEVVVDVPDLNGDYNEGYEQGHTDGYNEGYTEGEGIGYNQGKTDGISEQKSKLESISITENGTYSKEDGYNHIEVNVPDLNGSYDEGYNQGKTDGISEQKSKLESISITENGTYDREDGYNHIEVNVPDLNGSYDEGYAEGERVGYEQGKTDGVNEQKGKLSQITISENGTYTKEDGYSEVVVNVPDLNGSYNEGYNQGKIDGIDEQKGKLESINITENGRYTKEDGYNEIVVEVPGSSGDYNEGYEQGQADVAANARVLNVTENGNYLSKFSDPIMPTLVTGIYADGTKFHNYAYLEGISYDSGFIVSEDMKVEIWWKGDVSKTDKNLFGSQVNNNYAIFKIRIPDTAYRFDGEIAMAQVTYRNAESNRWYHFKISYADGFWVDGVKIGDFSRNISGTPYKLYINSNTPNSFNGTNGYFGMIKITTNGVENIIIPTAEGLKNITKNEMLQVAQNGSYTFTENAPIYPEGELYKTINVNVIPKINLQKAGLKLGYSSFIEVPEWADFEGITDMNHMFYECIYIKTIPQIDTSNVTTMMYMFQGCTNLKTIPLLNTSNVTNMSNMFYYCSNLQTIPPIDTSKVTNMGYMFYYCNNLRTLPELDASNVNYMGYYFRYGGSNLTDVGGWKNLKCNWNDNYGLKLCPKLTHQSCINILNGLYDFVGNGESTRRTLKVHQNFLTTVGEDISIGTSRGWTITA